MVKVIRDEKIRVLHSVKVLSSEQDNMVEPSGEKQQHQTAFNENKYEVVVSEELAVCPFNVLNNEPSRVLHSFRVLSEEPDNIVEPSGEKQQQ